MLRKITLPVLLGIVLLYGNAQAGHNQSFYVGASLSDAPTVTVNGVSDIDRSLMSSFWDSFSSMSDDLYAFYGDSVLILAGDVTEKYRLFSKRRLEQYGGFVERGYIQSIFDSLSRAGAKRGDLATMFRNAYSGVEYGFVKDASPFLMGFIRPDLSHKSDLNETLFKSDDGQFRYWRQFITVRKDDLYMVRKRFDEFSDQYLVFIFDSETMKVKAQTLMLDGLDSRYVPKSIFSEARGKEN